MSGCVGPCCVWERAPDGKDQPEDVRRDECPDCNGAGVIGKKGAYGLKPCGACWGSGRIPCPGVTPAKAGGRS